MGNQAGKDSHGPTGSHLDLFHTPPTSPSEAELAALALSSASTKAQKGTPVTPGGATPSTPTVTHWAHKLSIPPEWSVIGLDSIISPERTGRDAAMSYGRMVGKSGRHSSPVSPGQEAPVRGSTSEQSWSERTVDSGLELQARIEKPGEEMSLVLLSLMEHYRATLGLSPGQDATAGAVELLRRLLMEREELVEEVHSLKDTLRTERAEWLQFQCDLQVAVSVADRLRVEAEQALGALQERHKDVEGQLARALSGQQETDRELESLRAEHKDTRLRLAALGSGQHQGHAELDKRRHTLREKERMGSGDKEKESKDSEERQTVPEEEGQGREELEKQQAVKAEMGEERVESQNDVQDENDVTNQVANVEAKSLKVTVTAESHVPKDLNGTGKIQLTGKGVAVAYLRTLAGLETKKEEMKKEEECRVRDPRRILLSERSRSLSRLPLPTGTPDPQNRTPLNTSTTLPLCKKEDSGKGRRMDRILQRQDSWSSFSTKKQDEDQNSDYIKPQDGFSMLLRRHGGSRRNSLLRWCQSRTQGYENIEITNFSSSWEDGLAFCAVYHTYLPSHIPYSSLSPADKKENLGLAFQTGQSVGIMATLTVEEMLKVGGPDWQRVLGYVESIFRHFEM